jgi:hypothetical protein
MSTSVTNGGYYLKVKQAATVDADQDVAIKAGAVRQINRGITDISALNGIRLECDGGGILIDQAGNVSTTMGLTGPTQALGAPFGPTRRRGFSNGMAARAPTFEATPRTRRAWLWVRRANQSEDRGRTVPGRPPRASL